MPGDDIYHEVDRGIRLWDKMLLCCSESSLKSWWVDNEIGTAFEKEQQLMKDREAKVQVLVPLNLDGYLFSDKWKSGYQAQVRRRMPLLRQPKLPKMASITYLHGWFVRPSRAEVGRTKLGKPGKALY